VLRRNRFAYQPALDGVRAVAVAMVLVFHGGFGWMTGGYVGVSVFFTLSGYLITSLALVEHEQTGRLDVRAFYARRVRRLMPASLLCLVAVIVLAVAGVFAGVEHLRRDVWAAVVPVYNWVSLAGGKSYSELVAAVAEPASPLDHYWSLAIEEQFYWVWPLALIGVLRLHRRGRLVVVGGLFAVGAAAAPVIHEVWGPDAAYWATPARLGEILIGALLAVLFHGRAVDGAGLPRAVRWLAPAGLAVVVWAAVTWPAGSGPAYTGWLPVFALASAALIAGLQVDSPLRRLLSVRPLVLAGVISYGVYLFHWPVYAVVDGERTGLDGATLFALRVSVTIAVAALSFLLLERPIRHAGNLGWRPISAVTLGAGTAVVLLAATLPTERPAYWEVSASGPDEAAWIPTGSVAPVALVAPPAPAPRPTATTVAPTPRLELETRPTPILTTTPTTTATTTAVPAKPSRPVRILVVGDSTASATGQGLVAWAAEHDDLALVTVRWAPAFGFLRHGERPGLDAEFAATNEELDLGLHDELVRLRPDIVVLMSTIADVADRVFDDVGALAPMSNEFRARMAADYVAFVDRLVAAGVPRVAWVVPPEPLVAWSGELAELADPARWATLRQAIEHAHARRPDIVTVVDLAGWEAGHPADDRRPDGLHYSVDAAAAVATEFLAPRLLAAALS
jgi:peptidoglycan/LPS O-acetylase OafA/YrhL